MFRLFSFLTMCGVCLFQEGTCTANHRGLVKDADNGGFLGPIYSECNSSFDESEKRSFFIASPNYPNFYPRNQDCFFNVRFPKGYQVLVFFADLDIERSSKSKGCDADYVSLYPISTAHKLVRLCGKLSSNSSLDGASSDFQLNRNYATSQGNVLTIRFYSESNAISRRGFKFQIVPFNLCENVTLIAQNNLSREYCSLSNFPVAYYQESQLCNIKINFANSHQLNLKFTKFATSEGSLAIGDDMCAGQNAITVGPANSKNLKLCGFWTDQTSSLAFNFTNGSTVDVVVKIEKKSLSQISSKHLRQSYFGFCFRYESLQSSNKLELESCDIEDGWYQEDSHCFKVVFDYAMTWTEAKTYCGTAFPGGQLASITSPRVQSLLEHIIISKKEKDRKSGIPENKAASKGGYNQRYSAFWVGANDVKHENSFQWDDGQAFSYTNWFQGWSHVGTPYNGKYGIQPSDDGFSNQDCVEIRNHFRYATKGTGTTGDKYFWNDIFCNATNRFVCQKPNPSSHSLNSNYTTEEERLKKECKLQLIELTTFHHRQVITSGRFPDPYPNNMNCTTIVSTTKGSTIEMVFHDFLLEDGGPSCKYDFLEIIVPKDGTSDERDQPENDIDPNRTVTHKYCNDWTSKIKFLRVVARQITIRFKTDDSYAYRGYHATLRAFPVSQFKNPEKSLCDEPFVHFKTACYLISYIRVSWYIATRICKENKSQMLSIENTQDEEKLKSLLNQNPDVAGASDFARPTQNFWLGSRKVVVDTFVPEDSSLPESTGDDYPGYDYDVSSGSKSAAGKPTKEKHQHQEEIDVFNDQSNLCTAALVDKFQERKLMYNQFKCSQHAGYICIKKPLDLSKVKNRTIENEWSGTLVSANFPESYLNNLDYSVNIISNDSNSVIILWFDFVDIEKQENCLYDYLMLKEPFTAETLCGQVEGPDNLSQITYVTGGNSVSVVFHSDYSYRGLGYKLHWQVIPLNWCSGNGTPSLIDSSGTIESPGYPDLSLPSLDCSLTLVAPNNKKILLTLIDFDVGEMKKTVRANKCETSVIVKHDYVVIALDENRHITLCGSISANNIVVGEQFMSYGSRLTVYYRTKDRRFRSPFVKRKGFKFKYQVVSKEHPITTVLNLKNDSFGAIASLNYPFDAPFKSTHHLFIRAQVGNFIEIKAAKQTLTSVEEGFCSDDDADSSTVRIMITDSFGNTSFQPATPTIWSLCRVKSGPVGILEVADYVSPSNSPVRSKSTRSTFHVLLVTTTITEKRHGKRSLNYPMRNTFQFHYKVKKDPNLKNRTLYLAREYRVDSCIYNPCSSHGQCVQKKIKSEMVDICDCKPQWTGVFCHLTLCDFNPCGLYGKCQPDPNEDQFICHCNPGYIGKTCKDTVAICDRTNPCGDRGKCSLINGTPRCQCNPWYEGKYCERFRIRIQYKPLSQRMLEEPFWLGLITVAVVLALISLVYCLKKKFAERIEKFFAEEIERSKTQSAFGIIDPGSGPRYSLTSNAGVSVNVTPIHNSPPMIRSRSSIIGRLCKHGKRSVSNPGHLSDSEVAHRKDDFSDTESSMNRSQSRRFPSLTFFSQKSMLSSSFNISSSTERDEKSKILASLVGSGSSREKDRRMSLDDFFRMSEAKILKKRQANKSPGAISDTERNSPNGLETETSFTFYREPRSGPTIAEFHVITENSHEEDESLGSGNGSLTIESFPSILKQESEAESLLSSIQQIQKVSRSGLSLNELDDSSLTSCRPRLVRSISPRRPPSGFSSSSKTSSCSSSLEEVSPNHCPLPEITITQATIESFEEPQVTDLENMTTEEVDSPDKESSSPPTSISPSASPSPSSPATQMLTLPSEPYPIRRLSAPNPAVLEDVKNRSGSPSSQSCGTPVIKKSDYTLPGRKYSLELSVPKITINSGLHAYREKDTYDSPPQSAKEIKSSFSHLTAMNSSSDRTISESNLSTSGYSSFSSPGISRCNSSSPIPDEIGLITNLQALTIPEAPDETSSRDGAADTRQPKPRSTFGNFLTIPVIAYPVHHRSSSPKRKPAKEDSRVSERSGSLHVPAVQQDVIELQSFKPLQKRGSLNISSKRDRLLAMRQQYKTIAPTGVHDPAHQERIMTKSFQASKSMDSYPVHVEPTLQVPKMQLQKSPSSERARIQRNPSWPGYLKNSSDSEDTEVVCTRCPTRPSNPRRPTKRSISKSYSLTYNEGSSASLLSSKSNRKSRHKFKNIGDLLRYSSIDPGSSSPKTSSSKELEKCSSSDSLLSYSGDNLITVRSSTSLNRLCTNEKPSKHVKRHRKFRRANSELVYCDEDFNYERRHSTREPQYVEHEGSSLSQSYPALLLDPNERYMPQKTMYPLSPRRRQKPTCYSIPVSPSVDYSYSFGYNLVSPECVAIKLAKEKSKSNISFDCLSDTYDKYSLKTVTPDDDTTSDEAGSERTVLLRKTIERNESFMS